MTQPDNRVSQQFLAGYIVNGIYACTARANFIYSFINQ
jgi:hypothetical protein